MAEAIDPAAGLPISDSFDATFERLLAPFSEAERAQLRLLAAPHRLNPGLLAYLSLDGLAATDLLDALQDRGLAQELGQDWFVLNRELRQYLLRQLRAEPERFRFAHQRALRYFTVALEEGATESERGELELIYHLLAVDETAGLSRMRSAVERGLATYELGAAERLLDFAGEQAALLSATGQEWLGYWQMRVEQILQPTEQAGEQLLAMAERATDPYVRALAGRTLGERAVGERRWLEAIRRLQASLTALQRLGLFEEVARTEIILGSVYVSLAEATGGLQDDAPTFDPLLMRWLYWIRHAPFVAYRSLSRRYDFLPNLYFGSDYQNWLVVRVLYQARRHFTAALRQMEKLAENPNRGAAAANSDLLFRQLRIRRADIDYRIGRWQRADVAFAELAGDEMVRQNPYLLATVELSIGRSQVTRNPLLAYDTLRRSLAVFEEARDFNLSGTATFLMGQALWEMGDRVLSTAMFTRAASYFYRANNLLDATGARVAAEPFAAFAPPPLAPDPGDDGAGMVQARLSQRAYVARMPQTMLRIFRGLAFYVVLPLTYLLAYLLVEVSKVLVVLVAALAQVVSNLGPVAFALYDFLAIFPFLVGIPLVWLWLCELLYLGLGLLVSRLLPLRILTSEQPVYLVTTEEGCLLFDSQGERQPFLPWSEVSYTASLDRVLVREPFSLFSRFLVGNEARTLIVDGITSHYRAAKRDMQARIAAWSGQEVTRYNFDYAVLDGRWVGVAALAILLLSALAFFNLLGPDRETVRFASIFVRSPGGVTYELYFTSIFWWFMQWFLLIGPLVALAHLLYNQWLIQRVLGERAPRLYFWQAALLLALFTLLTAGYVWLLTL